MSLINFFNLFPLAEWLSELKYVQVRFWGPRF